MKAVLDAGPVIHLSWTDHLDLLAHLFDEAWIPLAVRDEVLAAPAGALGLDHDCYDYYIICVHRESHRQEES